MQSLLPYNATLLEKSLAELSARLEEIPVDIGTLYQAAQCPVALLPWLAWAFSVDVLPSDVLTQRRLLAKSLVLHQKKGTRAAVFEACARCKVNVTLLEWWETSPKRTPHTFEVQLHPEQALLTPFEVTELTALIDAMKPARSQYCLVLPLFSQLTMTLGLGFRMEQHVQCTVVPVYPLKTAEINLGIGLTLQLEEYLH